MERLTDEFQIVTESGDVFNILEYRTIIASQPLNAPKLETLGKIARLRTDDGRDVNALGDDRFQIVDSGTIGMRVRPD